MKSSINRVIFVMLLAIGSLMYVNSKNAATLDPINKLPYFSYITQNNQIFTTSQLQGKVTVVDFFFTQCEGPCPAMNRYMKQLVKKNDSERIQFVSFSVDPLNDDSKTISEYISTRDLEYENWYFLETELVSIQKLLEEGFYLSGDGLPGMHSTKFILIDSNSNIVGFYDPFLEDELSMLQKHIKTLEKRIS